MSEEKEPVRLRDDPSEDAELRAMLDAARGERADDAMLERVLAGVLAGGGGGGGGGSSGASTGVSTSAKLAAATAAIAATAGTIALLVTSDPAPPRPIPTTYPVVSTVPDASDTTPDAGPPPADAAPPDAGTTDAGPHGTARVRPPAPTTAPPSEPALDDAPLLLAATRSRATDPTRSLALALEHRSRFPASPGAEDREALVVLDLADLGRTAEARTAADSFRARWPRSAHLPHLDAALARRRPGP